MVKKKYLIWLPVCFVVAFGATFLIPKTYKSVFVVNQEAEIAVETERAMTFNRPENYDLGLSRTLNSINAYGYNELAKSDPFVRYLLDVPVCTIDGNFSGTYFEYISTYARKTPLEWIKSLITSPLQKMANKDEMASGDGTSSVTNTYSRKREAVKEQLINAIETDVDYETSLVTITCYAQDPLVSQTLAYALLEHLRDHIKAYEAAKMQMILTQVQEIVGQAEADYKNASNAEERAEKKVIYESFKRQQVVFKAQMMDVPAIVAVAEPSFSYIKESPSRMKFAIIMTVLLAIGFWCSDHHTKIREFLLK